jgi:hypothetical protein
VEAFDWNYPHHITLGFTQAKLEAALVPVRDELAALRRENECLRRELRSSAQRRWDAPEAQPESAG